jgi:hypothetical protein
MRVALSRLALTKDGSVRWDRLEGLLEESSQSLGFDVVLVVEKMAEFLLSDENVVVREKIVDDAVGLVDRVGVESYE